MAARITRINEEAKKEISAILRELKDPRVDSARCSILAVDVTNDLRWCKVFLSVLGDAKQQQDALDGMKSAAGFVRRELAHRLKLRYTPEVLFHLDHSIEHGSQINQILNDLGKGD